MINTSCRIVIYIYASLYYIHTRKSISLVQEYNNKSFKKLVVDFSANVKIRLRYP